MKKIHVAVHCVPHWGIKSFDLCVRYDKYPPNTNIISSTNPYSPSPLIQGSSYVPWALECQMMVFCFHTAKLALCTQTAIATLTGIAKRINVTTYPVNILAVFFYCEKYDRNRSQTTELVTKE